MLQPPSGKHIHAMNIPLPPCLKLGCKEVYFFSSKFSFFSILTCTHFLCFEHKNQKIFWDFKSKVSAFIAEKVTAYIECFCVMQ